MLYFHTFLIYITTPKVKGMVTLKCIAYLTKTIAKVLVNNLHSSPFLIKINTLMAAENAELNTSLFMEEVQK